MKKPGSKRRYQRKPRKAYRKITPKPSLLQTVKSVVHSMSETKHAYHATSNSTLTYFNSGINSTGDMLQIIPNISQGTSDNARIGDQIRSHNLNLRGYLKLDINTSGASNSDLTAVMVRLFVVSLKTKPNYTEATSSATPLSGLLKKGGTTTAFTGVLSDIYAPVNTDLWTVHHDKRFYLSQSMIQNFNNTTNAIVPLDIRNTVRFFNLNIKCKNKLLKYDSNVSSGVLPSNYGPIFMLGYSFLNAASPDVVSARVGVQYDTTLSYEDA